ncbi:ABC1 kinase family protein [Cerasicoccus fimbriatus]|uniref:ABC1 kinase family protein n=1 Tax=Cerasicoccus fimbriatus TaxID=3014554 RepID=UPI0022B4448B|nr:AarF/UbiB family protein [Cerasicoccus sp. TK19100]
MASPLKTLDLFSNVARGREIVTVLASHGFGDMLDAVRIPKGWIEKIVPPTDPNLNVWQRLRLVLEDLGPTFVKFGQVLSTRPDVLPEGLITEFKNLRSQVKPISFELIEPMLCAELGCGNYTEFFDDFDTNPVAAGSIGQVYKARLKDTDEWVAVKVQRPNIKKAIKADIEIIGWLVRMLHDRVEELQPYDLPAIVESTGKGILQELDFTIEANNAALFSALNPYEEVFAPKVYDQFAHERVTVFEWVEGRPPWDPAIPEDVRIKLAKAGGKSVFQQIVMSGFFHADPHGGNLIVTDDGRLCFIDWGLAGQLTREMRYFLADLFSAIAKSDPEKVCRVAMLMAQGKTRIDQTRLEQEVGFVLRQYRSKFDQNEAIGKIVIDLLFVFGSNGIQLARDYSLLAKAIISIEEVGQTLDPKFDIREVGKPFLRKLEWERWNPQTVTARLWWNIQGHLHKLRELPGDIQRFFRHLEDGEIKVTMKHEGLNDVGDVFDMGVNRLTMAIITAAILLASSIVIGTTAPKDASMTELYGNTITALAAFGFKLSILFGVWVIYDIIRHGRHK